MAVLRDLGNERDMTLVSTSVSDPLVGALVAGRYRVVRKIGEGGQASVYIAKHTLIKRLVALKALSPAMAADHDLVQRFLDEGEVAGTMGHPNIVESLDMGMTDDGRPFLVLEYLEGTTVAAELGRSGPFDLSRACFIGTQIASALNAAHARGIVHRDLKPENVFLVERETHGDHVKVLDFGISKIANRRGSSARDGLIVGTPEYMAMEQVTAPASVDSRADVYALGAMLYEMLSGRTPLALGEGENVLDVVVRRMPAPLGRICPSLPPLLVQTVERAMQKDRTKRTQTIDELRNVLEQFAVPSPTARPMRPSGIKPISTPPAVAPPPARSLTVPLLAGALGALAAGIIVFFALHTAVKPAPLVAAAAVTIASAPVETPVVSPPLPLAVVEVAAPVAQPRARVVYVAPAAPRPASVAAPVEKTAEKPDCDTPFYFTETGKKVFKPGCL